MVRVPGTPTVDPDVPALAEADVMVGVVAGEHEGDARGAGRHQAEQGGIEAVGVEDRDAFAPENSPQPREGDGIARAAVGPEGEGGGRKRPHRLLERTLRRKGTDGDRVTGRVVA